MSPTSTNPLSVYRARKLLNLEGTSLSSLTKKKIQKAYVLAAKKYHPDSNSRHNAPCAVKFRECHEARWLLLEKCCGAAAFSRRRTPSATSRPTAKPWYKPTNPKDHGFPHSTLRVLTLKQNLALRGMVMFILVVGALCDKALFV